MRSCLQLIGINRARLTPPVKVVKSRGDRSRRRQPSLSFRDEVILRWSRFGAKVMHSGIEKPASVAACAEKEYSKSLQR